MSASKSSVLAAAAATCSIAFCSMVCTTRNLSPSIPTPQALTASVVERKVQLACMSTRGLGAGGDPEIGYTAAEEGVEEIRQALDGAQIVFLCVGLGGGTGSGAARIVALPSRASKKRLSSPLPRCPLPSKASAAAPLQAYEELRPLCSAIPTWSSILKTIAWAIPSPRSPASTKLLTRP